MLSLKATLFCPSALEDSGTQPGCTAFRCSYGSTCKAAAALRVIVHNMRPLLSVYEAIQDLAQVFSRRSMNWLIAIVHRSVQKSLSAHCCRLQFQVASQSCAVVVVLVILAKNPGTPKELRGILAELHEIIVMGFAQAAAL